MTTKQKSPFITQCKPFDGSKCGLPAWSWGMCYEHYIKEATHPIHNLKPVRSLYETTGSEEQEII
jgi:hypothetical protein